MVSENTVKKNFFTELESALSGNSNISTDDIYLRGSEFDEDDPVVVYDTTKASLNYNDGSRGLYAVVTNNSDEVTAEVYREYTELTFDVQVLHTDQNIVDSIYEDIRMHFLDFEKRIREPEEIHSHVNHVAVEHDDRDPNYGVEPTQRFQRLPVVTEFYRRVTDDGEPIREVLHEIENVNYTTDVSNS